MHRRPAPPCHLAIACPISDSRGAVVEKPLRTVIPAKFLNPSLHWRPLALVRAPARIDNWLADSGSLTRRLQAFGHFQVAPRFQGVARPRAEEAALLGMRQRYQAVIREVLLLLDDEPVVFARSVLPLRSLRGRNRVLGHMARRSLGAELFKPPAAERSQVWAAHLELPADYAASRCWGRQSLFLKRGQPLLVAEIFLPSLWQRLADFID